MFVNICQCLFFFLLILRCGWSRSSHQNCHHLHHHSISGASWCSSGRKEQGSSLLSSHQSLISFVSLNYAVRWSWGLSCVNSVCPDNLLGKLGTPCFRCPDSFLLFSSSVVFVLFHVLCCVLSAVVVFLLFSLFRSDHVRSRGISGSGDEIIDRSWDWTTVICVCVCVWRAVLRISAPTTHRTSCPRPVLCGISNRSKKKQNILNKSF